MGKNIRGINLIFILLLGALLLMVWSSSMNQMQDNYTRGALEEDLKAGNVTSAVITQNRETPTGSAAVLLKGGQNRTLYVTNVEEAIRLFEDYSIDPVVRDVPRESWFMNSLLPMLVVAVIIMVFFFMMMNAQNAGAGAGGNKMMNFGKSRARMSVGADNKITLKDVAGLKEEKEELQEIVDFLREPSKFTRVGARIPKGVLLEGPPGTGKTLLAKAIAGEANVPFFSISGSDFVEMFVGVGASRVRDLFEEAKKNSPCIVFIDEIDAVARRRGTGMGGGHDEREQTLNQLLVEMDGFGVNEGIIVMAATNRVDILDPAILRPGRFDRKISVGTPDVGGREDILKLHARNKPLADDVNLKQVAQTTAGFTGADLENLLNEAAILAAESDRVFVSQEDIQRAFIKVGIGSEKRSRIISDAEKKITAYHESGHAILFHVLPDVGPVYTVSIIPTGIGAAGYTMPLPERDDMFMTKGRLEEEIMVSLGGRIAEQLIFDDITTGADLGTAPDEAFAQKMMGDGAVVTPEEAFVCAPEDGEVAFVFDTKHAIGYMTDSGISLLIHVGIDTVKLNGEGFEVLVENGQKVKKGQPMLKLDLDYLKANAPSLATPVLCTELEDDQRIRLLKEGPVKAGEPLFEVEVLN